MPHRRHCEELRRGSVGRRSNLQTTNDDDHICCLPFAVWRLLQPGPPRSPSGLRNDGDEDPKLLRRGRPRDRSSYSTKGSAYFGSFANDSSVSVFRKATISFCSWSENLKPPFTIWMPLLGWRLTPVA